MHRCLHARSAFQRIASPHWLMHSCALACVCVLLHTPVSAQETELRDDVGMLAQFKYSRTAAEAFAATAESVDPEWREPRLVEHWVHAADWSSLSRFLATFEPDAARRIHSKICSDLLYSRPRSKLSLVDVVALADTSPVELEGKQVIHIGGLIRVVMEEAESDAALIRQLQVGTKRLGGDSESRRMMAAQLLHEAKLSEAAKLFWGADIPQSKANSVDWKVVAASLEKAVDEGTQTAILDEAVDALLNETPVDTRSLLDQLKEPTSSQMIAKQILARIGQRVAEGGESPDMSLRARLLELQQAAVNAMLTSNEDAWQVTIQLMADNWLQAARHTRTNFPLWKNARTTSRTRYEHVKPEQLLRSAPSGRWEQQLDVQTQAFLRIAKVHLYLLTEDVKRALPLIQKIQKTDGAKAAELANAVLDAWVAIHDPNLSEEVLKEYRLEQQAIVLTRAEQEASLRDLSELLRALDPAVRDMLDSARLVQAFDYCHSRAEVYTREQVELVFGALKNVPEEIMSPLMDRMRNKLAKQWRDLAVQREGATQRSTADVFEMVHGGYLTATQMTHDWNSANPGVWQLHCVTGSLRCDWAEFYYFRNVAGSRDDRFSTYLQQSELSLDEFRKTVEHYSTEVAGQGRDAFELTPFLAWFHGLLGISHEGGVNLRKGVTRQRLLELREAMLSMPDGAGELHLEMFSSRVAENIEANVIAPEMKYRYLSSAIEVTGRRATVYPAAEKIAYYDSLLDELRLQTRLDGEARVSLAGDFGVFVSLLHTAAIARESGGFSDYLRNQVQKTYSGRTVTEKPLYRDRFEESMRLALGDFFEVRTILFADPNLTPREVDAPSEALGKAKDADNSSVSGVWQETPLCYLLLRPRDASVDRIPEFQMELDFFDRDGKVVIPTPSNPIEIEVVADRVHRPAGNLSITQIVDSRQLAEGQLKIDISVKSSGLPPLLPELLELDDYRLPLRDVAMTGDVLLTDLLYGPDGMVVRGEQNWVMELDPTPLSRKDGQVEFQFPKPASAETEMIYQQYDDVDPVEAAAAIVLAEAGPPSSRLGAWMWGGAALATAIGIGAFLSLRRTPSETPAVAPRFALPSELTPFSVVALLHRIETNAGQTLDASQRKALSSDIQDVERSGFQKGAALAEERWLRDIASKWIDVAT